MATELRLRRGTTDEHGNFIGAEAEATVDTDKNTIVVHDGQTQGGSPLATEDTTSKIFDSVSDMKADAGLAVGQRVRTLGYYSPGDGGGNDYEVVPGGTGTADDGSFIDLASGLQAKGLFITGNNANQWGAGSGDTSGATDTAAIQAYWDWSLNYYDLSFNPRSIYYLNSTINAPVSYRTIDATGARFVIVEDGTTSDPVVAFDLNPDADPDDVNGSNKTYGQWRGGYFSTTISNPVGVAAFKVFAIRQMVVRDSYCEGLTYFTMIAGLGGHLFHKNRLIKNKVAFYCPDWTNGGPYTSSTSITTCKFSDNEFIVETGQKLFFVDCGWRSWKIYGGFSNGSEGEALVHFTNRGNDSRDIEIRGLAFEQAATNGKYVYFEDVGGDPFTSLDFRMYCAGDPAGGGHVAVDLENCQQVKFDGGRYDGNTATGNTSLRFDANCQDIEVSRAARTLAEGVVYSCSRRQITVIPEKKNTLYQILPSFSGQAFSTSEQTIDMATELGSQFPINFNPLGYTLLVRLRDSGSSTLASRRAEFYENGNGGPLEYVQVDLNGVPDNTVRVNTIYVPADSDGNIYTKLFASGTDTLEIWISVLEIHQ